MENHRYLPLNCPQCSQVIFYTHLTGTDPSKPPGNTDRFFDCTDEAQFSAHKCYDQDDERTNYQPLNIKKLRENYVKLFAENVDPGRFEKFIRLTLSPAPVLNNFTRFGLFVGEIKPNHLKDVLVVDTDAPQTAPAKELRFYYRVIKTDGQQIMVECAKKQDIKTGRFVRFKIFRKKGLKLFRCDTMLDFTPELKISDAEEIYLLTLDSEHPGMLEYRTEYFYHTITKSHGKVMNAYPAKIKIKNNTEIYTRKIRFSMNGSAKVILENTPFLENVNISISQDD